MKVMVGLDEVGRGCWAGPLVAGAVILDPNFTVSKLQSWKLGDSKQLTKHQREVADYEIRKRARSIGLGWVTAGEVDSMGLTAAVKTAMQRALDQINIAYQEIIIDGSFNFFPENKLVKAIIKADQTIPTVSAASIIAKVARDAYMLDISQKYPRYQFHKHVGYGTQLHAKMLKQYGPCDLHRKSYKPIKKFLVVSD